MVIDIGHWLDVDGDSINFELSLCDFLYHHSSSFLESYEIHSTRMAIH